MSYPDRLIAYLVIVVLPCVCVAAAASYVTSLSCRFAHLRHWHVGWHLGLVGAGATATITGLLVCLGFALQPGGWGKDDFGIRLILFWICAGGSALGIVPSEVVVWRHRKRLRGAGHLAEPGAAPNGGPATPAGNSGVAEGPPSVS